MKFIFPIVLFLLPLCGFSQMKLSFAMGTGTYRMTELRNLTQNAKNSFAPFPAKVVDNFPSYYVYDLGLTMVFDNGFLIGGGFSFTSSGSRVSYRDYSGSLQFDATAKGLSYGTSIGYRHSFKNNMFLTFDFRHGSTESSIDLVHDYDGAYSLSQSSLFVQPTVIFSKVYKRFSFDAHAGYFASIRSALFEVTISNTGTSSGTSSEELIADWSGARVGLGIGYILSKKKQRVENEGELYSKAR
jgi:hypothetical protein